MINLSSLTSIFILLFSFYTQAQNYQSYPENIYADTLHAPFYHGVASADPLIDKVLLWTRISPENNPLNDSLSVYWEISLDSSFTSITDSGTIYTDSMKDWTLTVDAGNLSPNTYYYYRFQDSLGKYSAKGRTKTAPTGNNTSFEIGVVSCSSIFSGFFNAYSRMAENDDIDLIVHLGDYIYDFVDVDEEVRIPTPYPLNSATKEQWRDRHSYYLLDPDFRKAKQMHPFVVIWDNHDVKDKGIYRNGSIEAFREWVPVRSNKVDSIYRNFSYGNLVDLIMMDVHLYKDVDEIAPGEYSFLGNTQYEWLTNKLINSTAQWKLLGSEKMFGGFYAKGLPETLPIPRDGDVFNTNSWDGYMLERENLLKTIRDSSINNVMVLSGDMHFTTAMNLVVDPFDTLNYNPLTGDGAVGTEFLPTSISRGNFDERGLPVSIAEAFTPLLMRINPQIVHMELVSHGYGLLRINQNEIRAEYHYCPILEKSTEDILAKTLVMKDKANKWDIGNPYVGIESKTPQLRHFVSSIFPNPVNGKEFFVDINTSKSENIEYSIFNAGSGQEIFNGSHFNPSGYNSQSLKIDASELNNGIYLIKIKGEDWEEYRKIVRY